MDKSQLNINKYFRFRFISRGEVANMLTRIAVKSLQYCHPGTHVTVIDANDTPQLKVEDFQEVHLVHIIPCNDEIAKSVGRGSRKHLFYWRHSPVVLSAIPSDTEFGVYMDSDIIFIRPMDLSSLVDLLRMGRIAVAVDESLITYINLIQERTNLIKSILNVPGACGPLLQAGLIFCNNNINEIFFNEFWRLSEIAATENLLELLPFDDMTLITLLLTRGGKFWDRWLPLSPEWNFITTGGQDPGVFAVGAHYGGFKAKNLLLENLEQFTIKNSNEFAWGSVANEFKNDKWYFRRGLIPGLLDDKSVLYELDSPFAISNVCLNEYQSFKFSVKVKQGVLENIFIFVDGKLHSKVHNKEWHKSYQKFSIDVVGVVTLIAPAVGSNINKVMLRIEL